VTAAPMPIKCRLVQLPLWNSRRIPFIAKSPNRSFNLLGVEDELFPVHRPRVSLGPFGTQGSSGLSVTRFFSTAPFAGALSGPMLTVLGVYFCNRAAQSTAIRPFSKQVLAWRSRLEIQFGRLGALFALESENCGPGKEFRKPSQ
jgi:hypothetical protein